MTRPPLTHAPHVFVDDLESLRVAEEDDFHLNVLRIKVGAPVVVCDGTDAWRLCRRTAHGVEPDGVVEHLERPTPVISIAFALTKGDKPELVVQKLTELGVDQIVPFITERSVVKWDGARALRNLERWRRIGREAAMQSRRVTMPFIDEVLDVRELGVRGFARADRGGAPLRLDHAAVAIGPEGGFTDDERALLPSAVTLAGTVLRAETAAIAAAAVLTTQRDEQGDR